MTITTVGHEQQSSDSVGTYLLDSLEEHSINNYYSHVSRVNNKTGDNTTDNNKLDGCE